jgi:hypothetical protein
MVDRIPSFENEEVYDRDAGNAIPLSDLHQLGKAVGSRVADVGNGTHHEPAAEGCDTLVESTDLDPLNLSREQVHSDTEELKHEGMEWWSQGGWTLREGYRQSMGRLACSLR